MTSRSEHRRQLRQRRKVILPAILIGVALIGAALILSSRQAEGGGNPRIAVDQQRIDYGYVKFGETRSFAVAVTNVGDGVLRFKEKPYIEILEGC
jgi:hypothetical protein